MARGRSGCGPWSTTPAVTTQTVLAAKEFLDAELDRQRDEVAGEAFGVLSQSLTKAVETLVGLLDHKDHRVQRLTAKDIIEHFLKHKELKELEQRIEAIEGSLEGQR